jgi:SAM-dependent methyltransferase
MKLNDPELVRREYETEAGLAVRRETISRFLEGPNALEIALTAVLEADPDRVLEVGCGMGQFAERVGRELDTELVAIDLAPRMVDLARERNVDARVGDVQALPFAENEFDCVIANWMLYHVPDLDAAVRELARVLRAGGRLVAATLGEENLADLWRLVDYPRPSRPFTAENGAQVLGRHFSQVERRDVEATLVFPDRAAVQRYVDSSFFAAAVEKRVPEVPEPFRVRTVQAVFVAEK